MKNKLEPWEEGLAGRMKEHEFSFDPAAMAGFESLLAAETTVAGEAAPGEAVTPTSSVGGGVFSGKVLGLLLGVLVAGGLLFYGLSDPETAPPESVAAEMSPTEAPASVHAAPAEEVKVTETMATPIASEPVSALPTNQKMAPAAAPATPAPEQPELIGGTPPSVTAYSPPIDLPRPMPTSGTAVKQDQSLRAMAIPVLTTRQNQIIAPLNLRLLPSVRITLESAQMSRDRNALFPEVLDKN